MPAVSSSPIPAVLAKLGLLDAGDLIDVRSFLEAVPDPRSRRGRWYTLASILLVCACATLAGATTIDQCAEWAARCSPEVLTTLGVRRHLLGWRCAPSRSAIGRVLDRLDGDALDQAVGAWLAQRHTAATTPPAEAATAGPPTPARRCVIAVDGKVLKGSAHTGSRHRHLLSAVTHEVPVTLAQAEVGAKTNETGHFKPLLAPLDLAGVVVTFDALHTVQDHARWLVEEKKAHDIAVIKTNQPTAHAQLDALPWNAIPVAHTVSNTGHGRRESRSIKTLAVHHDLGGLTFPKAKLAIRVHRRRQTTGKKQPRTTIYAVTSLDAHQATPGDLAACVQGHWQIEAHHHVRDRVFGEDVSTVHTGSTPRAMASFRNLATGALRTLGATNIAKTTRAIRDNPTQALTILGINPNPNPSET